MGVPRLVLKCELDFLFLGVDTELCVDRDASLSEMLLMGEHPSSEKSREFAKDAMVDVNYVWDDHQLTIPAIAHAFKPKQPLQNNCYSNA